MSDPETKKNYLPWYKHFREEFSKASKYIHAVEYEYIKQETLETFDKETLARFIFESNNIEREGLPFGETRELVIFGLNEYPEIFKENDKQMQNFEPVNLLEELQELKKELPIEIGFLNHSILNKDSLKNNQTKLNQSKYELIAKYGNKKKEANKVYQYVMATLTADIDSWNYRTSLYKKSYFLILQRILEVGSSEKRQNAQKSLDGNFPNGLPVIEPLITEERIKSLHELMATGFVDKKNAKAGQYRTKPIMTDMESHYPAPEDIPTAMSNFVAKYQEYEAQNLNPIALAAWASTQFVLIHPFSDFNGRMSRLLMNMVFRAHGVPFWVSLRSSGKERTRYLTALKHYRRKNYLSIATLISIQINRGFDDLNNILELSGYPPINIDDLKDFPSEFSDNLVYFHKWDH